MNNKIIEELNLSNDKHYQSINELKLSMKKTQDFIDKMPITYAKKYEIERKIKANKSQLDTFDAKIK